MNKLYRKITWLEKVGKEITVMFQCYWIHEGWGKVKWFPHMLNKIDHLLWSAWLTKTPRKYSFRNLRDLVPCFFMFFGFAFSLLSRSSTCEDFFSDTPCLHLEIVAHRIKGSMCFINRLVCQKQPRTPNKDTMGECCSLFLILLHTACTSNSSMI